MHDTQKKTQENNKQQINEKKDFSLATLHEAAFGPRSKIRIYEEWDDDDADCYCD